MQRPLRLWPGIAAAAIVIAGLLVTATLPVAADYGLIATGVGVFAIIVWWLFFSRAPWLERVGALVLMVVAVAAIRPFIHASIAGGAQGALQYMLSMLPMSLLLVAWAAGTRHLSTTTRRASMAVAILAGSTFVALLRTDGIGGAAMFELRWRWTPTAEERLLAEVKDDPIAPPARPEPIAEPVARPHLHRERRPDARAGPGGGGGGAKASRVARVPWTRTRRSGPGREDRQRLVCLSADRTVAPADWPGLVVVCRRRRSHLHAGTARRRRDRRVLSAEHRRARVAASRCRALLRVERWRRPARHPHAQQRRRLRVWRHRGAQRARRAHRCRPLVANAAADTKEDTPVWGFSSSPLIVGDVVVVATGGTLAGYDVATGKPRWLGSHHGFSYSSPHLVTVDGVAQVLLLAPPGVFSVSPSDGTMLWEHTWEGGGIVQPAVTPDGDILVSGLAGAGGSGVRRLAVRREGGTWTVQERWTSNGLKPYLNDYVVHNGHAFGFDGSILSSIDLADGTRKWKGGRYGAGQLVLLPDQDLLLVLSEEGGLALVSATPDRYTEIARAPAIEGKTWNHPVLVGDVLLVRNGEEMAAFRLALAR